MFEIRVSGVFGGVGGSILLHCPNTLHMAINGLCFSGEQCGPWAPRSVSYMCTSYSSFVAESPFVLYYCILCFQSTVGWSSSHHFIFFLQFIACLLVIAVFSRVFCVSSQLAVGWSSSHHCIFCWSSISMVTSYSFLWLEDLFCSTLICLSSQLFCKQQRNDVLFFLC